MHIYNLIGSCFLCLFQFPTYEGAEFRGKCKDFGLVGILFLTYFDLLWIQENGELKVQLVWECFPNKTAICFQKLEDCSKCNGEMIGQSVDVSLENPTILIGNMDFSKL